MKKLLNLNKGRCFDFLEEVLRLYSTTKKSSTGETPFRLAYGTEVIVRIEVSVPLRRIVMIMSLVNEDMLKENLTQLGE